MIKKLLLTFFTLFICSVGFSQSDGKYCADVESYNPKTQRESSYTLVVDVQDQKLVRMHWSNGGYSDSGEFNPPIFSNNVTSFSDYDNVQFKVVLTKQGAYCFDTPLRQCSGTTKAGNRCRNWTGRDSGKCYHHLK